MIVAILLTLSTEYIASNYTTWDGKCAMSRIPVLLVVWAPERGILVITTRFWSFEFWKDRVSPALLFGYAN